MATEQLGIPFPLTLLGPSRPVGGAARFSSGFSSTTYNPATGSQTNHPVSPDASRSMAWRSSSRSSSLSRPAMSLVA